VSCMYQTMSRICVVVTLLILISACANKNHKAALYEPNAQEQTKSETTVINPDAQQGTVEQWEEPAEETVADPLEPWNRAMFVFNDRVYFWLMKPVIRGYNTVVPLEGRQSVRNFFYNLDMPTRFTSSILQADIKAAGKELLRFSINTIIGFFGLFDVAATGFHIEPQKKDIGQTLGKYGLGEGFYIVWPFLGPSSARDAVGLASDLYLSPWVHVKPSEVAGAIGAYDYFNESSLDSGDYEELVNSAIEPYAALKNAYIQYRRSIVKEQ